ncbi:hypothetical protein DQ04_02471090 [Trypanosoma grayi]|uniref:hypothetical protein n=1 Tax=Trypanosoma grayi TaxID=71804 RepID=UPI0004F3F6A2|nr:hypothetical protein DQ04_02471090 [Trypanosoma grayi]KEG11582.1 hypothetical protein DQ04_02471090 [Trypanosoma grayi]
MCTDLSNIDINDSEEGEDEDDDDDYEEDDNGNDDHKNADTEQKSKKNGAKKEGKKNGAKQKGKKDGLQQESTLKEVIEKVEGSVSSDNEAEKAQVKESDGGFSEPRLWSALVLFAAAASVLLVP